MGHGISYISFMVLLVVAISISNINFGEAGDKYHVHVSNGLSNNNKLIIHCKSKDDDLGEHVLSASQEWSWTFRANFWGTTLYWCRMTGGNHYGSFEVFAMYHALLDMCNFKECFWSARDDGIYLKKNSDGSWLLTYKWEH